MIWMCVLLTSRDTWETKSACILEALQFKSGTFFLKSLTLTLLIWRIWWAPNNDSRWQMGFNLAFEGYTLSAKRITGLVALVWKVCAVSDTSFKGHFNDICDVVLLTTFSKYGPKLHLSCVATWFSDMTEPDSYKFPTFTEPKVSLLCSEQTNSGPCSEWNACSPCPHTACVWEPLQYYFLHLHLGVPSSLFLQYYHPKVKNLWAHTHTHIHTYHACTRTHTHKLHT
jgi:hypothetical protein